MTLSLGKFALVIATAGGLSLQHSRPHLSKRVSCIDLGLAAASGGYALRRSL